MGQLCLEREHVEPIGEGPGGVCGGWPVSVSELVAVAPPCTKVVLARDGITPYLCPAILFDKGTPGGRKATGSRLHCNRSLGGPSNDTGLRRHHCN